MSVIEQLNMRMSFDCIAVCCDSHVECQNIVNWLQKKDGDDEFHGCLGYE